MEKEQTRYCSNCGKPMNTSAGFCPSCGTQMGLAQQTPPPIAMPIMTMKPKRKVGRYIAAIAGLIVFVVVLAVMMSAYNTSGGASFIPAAHISIIDHDAERTLTGDADITFTVKNSGGAAGDATIVCTVWAGSNEYSSSKSVYLNAGQSATYTVGVDIGILDLLSEWSYGCSVQ